ASGDRLHRPVGAGSGRCERVAGDLRADGAGERLHPDPQRGDDDLRRVPGVAGRPGVLAGGAGGRGGQPGGVVDRLGRRLLRRRLRAAALGTRAEAPGAGRAVVRALWRSGGVLQPHAAGGSDAHLAAGGDGADAVRPFLGADLPGLHPVVHLPGRRRRYRRVELEDLGGAAARARLPGDHPARGGRKLVATATKAAGSGVDFSAVPVPLMDIRGQYAELLPEIKQLVCDVIDSGRFILGPNVRALESEFAATIGYGEAVAVANGTDALELSLQALGVGRDDEVITTPYTFYATAEAIARTGATPVFDDIDLDTFALAPGAAERAITEG